MNMKAAIGILNQIDQGRTIEAREVIAQIGQMNYWAISGGRSIKGDSTVLLPVDAGYWVAVTLDASDTYTVRRVFVRAGKVTVKREWADVYCDEVGEIAYEASCFRDVA